MGVVGPRHLVHGLEFDADQLAVRIGEHLDDRIEVLGRDADRGEFDVRPERGEPPSLGRSDQPGRCASPSPPGPTATARAMPRPASGNGRSSSETPGESSAGEQDHRRLPHLAARVERSQLERRAFVDRFAPLRCDQPRCEIERGGDRIGVVGVAVTEQRLRRERHADEVCDLGVDRRRQTRRQRRDHLVGLVTAGLDREGPARLQVDEHVRSRRADTELHERDARQADPARASSASNSIGTSASRHHAWPPPTHGAGSVAAPVKRSSTRPSPVTCTQPICTPVPTSDAAAARHATSTRTRPFARVDRSEATFRLGHLGSRRRHAMAGHRRSQTPAATHSDERQDARGEQCRVLHPDRGRGAGGISPGHPAGLAVTHRRHHGGRRGRDGRGGRRGAVAAAADAGADVVGWSSVAMRAARASASQPPVRRVSAMLGTLPDDRRLGPASSTRRGRVVDHVGDLQVPARQDQVRVVERSATSHVPPVVAFPDLGPVRRFAELVVGDVPQRVARLHLVGGRAVDGRGDRRWDGRSGSPACRNLQRPTLLDVGRVGESLPR